MSDHPRKQQKELARILEDYGISIVSSELGRKHRKMIVTDGSKKALITVSVSPGDRRVMLNIAATARGALRSAR
jgi:hypothetical protein